ncbi:hypothetical protein MUN74_16515 [Agromyces endophyticus]|uniref:hypothetical protein n=1 Tax=Agromyces sp. H17E-10 TaxID=2932244 RepID=UPI001FD503C0|nr:hypothetical protein [Agromyces sp. H17E-10]UOQ88850.1 hypothetical protein MUN74_16515 [Agromyces sp. H17E-10]
MGDGNGDAVTEDAAGIAADREQDAGGSGQGWIVAISAMLGAVIFIAGGIVSTMSRMDGGEVWAAILALVLSGALVWLHRMQPKLVLFSSYVALLLMIVASIWFIGVVDPSPTHQSLFIYVLMYGATSLFSASVVAFVIGAKLFSARPASRSRT